MNFEPLTLNLSDLELLLAKSHCSCHFINPNKTRIILWKEVKDEVVTYYLRIGIQKFISYPLTDKNQELYWKFKFWEGKEEKPIATTSELSSQENITTPNSELDPVTKFQQRQAKTESLNHGKPNDPEPAVIHS